MIDKNNTWSAKFTLMVEEEPKTIEIHAGEKVYQFSIMEMGLTEEGDLVIHTEEGHELVLEKGLKR